MPAILEFL